MAKTAQIARILLAFAIGPGAASLVVVPQHVFAQANTNQEQPDRLLRGRNIAPTGETLPHPGASQIGSETAQEKGAQKRSDRDTHSICSNCE